MEVETLTEKYTLSMSALNKIMLYFCALKGFESIPLISAYHFNKPDNSTILILQEVSI